MNQAQQIRASLACGAIVVALMIGGCASDGAVYGSVSYNYGYGFYDPWYRNDVIVVNPPARPRPPVHRPPVRPRPLPARPLPRPAPRGRMR